MSLSKKLLYKRKIARIIFCSNVITCYSTMLYIATSSEKILMINIGNFQYLFYD